MGDIIVQFLQVQICSTGPDKNKPHKQKNGLYSVLCILQILQRLYECQQL